jgi:hypothetical protein
MYDITYLIIIITIFHFYNILVSIRIPLVHSMLICEVKDIKSIVLWELLALSTKNYT